MSEARLLDASDAVRAPADICWDSGSVLSRGEIPGAPLLRDSPLHAFIFLALAVSELLKFTQSAVLVVGTSLIASIWIPIYATLAFRRVYGGSLARTLVKEVAIAAIYAVTAAAGFITMIYWVSVAT